MSSGELQQIDISPLAFAAFCLTVLCVCWFLRRHRGHVEAVSAATEIFVERPGLVTGSPPHVPHLTKYALHYERRHRELGNSFFRYDGVRPVLVTIEPSIVRAVLVEKFGCFGDLIDFGKVRT